MFDGAFDLKLALQGDLEAFESGLREGVLRGMKEGLQDTVDQGLDWLREDLRRGLPNLSEKTWRKTTYPGGTRLAWDPTAYLYSKADAIVTAFDEGGEIESDGKLMTVPLPYLQQRLPKTRNRYSKSKIQTVYDMFGEENLEIVPATPERPAMLILKVGGITKTGRIQARKRTKTGKLRKGTGRIPLMFLVDRITLQKALNVAKLFDRTTDALEGKIVAALNRNLREFA